MHSFEFVYLQTVRFVSGWFLSLLLNLMGNMSNVSCFFLQNESLIQPS